VLAGAPFGHGRRNEAFVLGAPVRIRGTCLEHGLR
jgi:muramoyltetrapeptide carboxypeptidase LdcA involved in peptidoglycan recycling